MLDTNAYVELNVSRLKAIQACERSQGVVAASAHHTLLELIAGTLDSDERRAAYRVGALKRLYHHCNDYDGSLPHLRQMVFSDAQAAFDLFGQKSTTYPKLVEPLLSLAHYQATREDPTWGPVRAVAQAVKDSRDAREKQFVDALFRSVVQRLAPDAATWADVVHLAPLRAQILEKAARGEGKLLLGRSIVIRAARHIGREVSEEEIERRAVHARDQYPVPIAIMDGIIQSIVRDGRDMSRPANANSLWDYEIAFAVGRGTHIDGAPVNLITTDREILRAAASVNAPNVRSLADYERLLALPYAEFRQEVDLTPIAR